MTVESVGQSLGDTLTFVIACTGPNRVDMSPAVARSGTEYGNGRVVLTSLRAAGEPPDHRKPLKCWSGGRECKAYVSVVPEVEVMRKRALVRFARPSMFSVPMKDVLIVFTALNW